MSTRPGQVPQVVGLIGNPVAHSISPAFQQAAFDYLRLPIRYEPWNTPLDRLPETVKRMRRDDCLGANVTVPHKQNILSMIDKIDAKAARIGAVNSIRNEAGQLTGFNTDGIGFMRALEDTGFIVRGARTAVIGAGGSARAVAFALAWGGVARLDIFSRRPLQARDLAADVARDTEGQVRSGDLTTCDAAIADADLVVNCTPLGMLHGDGAPLSPLTVSQIRPDSLVYDLVYNPPVTPLLAEASKAGARTLGGLRMLVYQGVAAFELWTGQKPPVGLMMARAQEALGLPIT